MPILNKPANILYDIAIRENVISKANLIIKNDTITFIINDYKEKIHDIQNIQSVTFQNMILQVSDIKYQPYTLTLICNITLDEQDDELDHEEQDALQQEAEPHDEDLITEGIRKDNNVLFNDKIFSSPNINDLKKAAGHLYNNIISDQNGHYITNKCNGNIKKVRYLNQNKQDQMLDFTFSHKMDPLNGAEQFYTKYDLSTANDYARQLSQSCETKYIFRFPPGYSSAYMFQLDDQDIFFVREVTSYEKYTKIKCNKITQYQYYSVELLENQYCINNDHNQKLYIIYNKLLQENIYDCAINNQYIFKQDDLILEIHSIESKQIKDKYIAIEIDENSNFPQHYKQHYNEKYYILCAIKKIEVVNNINKIHLQIINSHIEAYPENADDEGSLML